ncbi:AAA family ATPase [Arcobacter sp. L]|uniref:AAA family ATPase n=1 Tax=Arcobacter sp. L TaxID=944547 RepID=UPI000229604D|nr:AAA family ATPase [Arcobacter sp. L]BAK74060.1 ATPase [Arcobacter sp. L]
MKIELKELIDALNYRTKNYLEKAAQRTIERMGNEIIVEDLFYAMLLEEESLLFKIIDQYNLNLKEFQNIIENSSKLSITESTNPVFSNMLIQLLEDSYFYSIFNFSSKDITENSLVLSFFENIYKYSKTKYFTIFKDVNYDELKKLILTEKDTLDKKATQSKSTREKTSLLEQYTVNLTNLAKEEKLDSVLCREDEISQVIDILLRRRKNNPILVGEAGVGKTAVAEGLAIKIIKKQVPKELYYAEILSLDMGILQAGASVKGEFEKRLQGIIKEIQSSSKFIILFIDEAHTLIGSGNSEGSSDAANLLKPALSRGELRTLAATTWLEYRKYFEKDAALSRRFQKVNIFEPSVEETTTILRGLSKKYEESHNVYIEDEALFSASFLSARYINGRQLPDKAIDVLDTACTNVKIMRTNLPKDLQVIEVQLEEKNRELESLSRDNDNSIKDYKKEIKKLELEIKNLKNKYKKIEEQKTDSSPNVTKEDIAKVVSSWTGIPLGNMIQEQMKNILNLSENLKKRVIGQEKSVEFLSKFLQVSIAGLKKENSPNGVFLLVGPSGVGKTETARSVAELLYGSERFLTVINMTEFQEKHAISRLIGSPPGYVGYSEGGQLTDFVRIRPYSVVLLDEIEKAHPDILNLFYQIFDRGEVSDSEGRIIDFKNTIIFLTSNLATEIITELCLTKTEYSLDEINEYITPTLSNYLKAALLGRMNVVPFLNLKEEALKQIVELKFSSIKKQLHKRDISLKIEDSLLNHIVSISNTIDTGARNIDYIINMNVLPKISNYIINASLNKTKIKYIDVSLDNNLNIIIK